MNSASCTYLIAGLGNPGREYRCNRHNIGFMVLDHLAAEMGLSFSRLQFHNLVTNDRIDGKKVILAKAQTFMNESGQAIGQITRFYRIDLFQMLVICDDLDLPFGKLRLRPSGGSAGHKGLNSIIDNLGSQEFPRLRIGLGRPPGTLDPADFVLQNFSKQEQASLDSILRLSIDCILMFINDGLQAAMNKYNSPNAYP